MANLGEQLKGITFFIFVTILFYFLWSMIFSNIIEFVGTDLFNIGTEAGTSLGILKTLAWVSFIFLYLSVGGVYLFYSIIMGSKGEIDTNPIMLLKAIGVWSVMMPFLTFIYGLMFFLVDTLNGANLINDGMETTASGFAWIMALIAVTFMTLVPFYYVLLGYGVIKEEKAGVNE